MLPCFVLEEKTIRESGESTVLDLGVDFPRGLTLTLEITHAVERGTLHMDVLGSHDGELWGSKPMASFPAKNYCGNYEAHCGGNFHRYLKAVWHVAGGTRGGARPLFELSLSVGQPIAAPPKMLAMAGAA